MPLHKIQLYKIFKVVLSSNIYYKQAEHIQEVNLISYVMHILCGHINLHLSFVFKTHLPCANNIHTTKHKQTL